MYDEINKKQGFIINMQHINSSRIEKGNRIFDVKIPENVVGYQSCLEYSFNKSKLPLSLDHILAHCTAIVTCLAKWEKQIGKVQFRYANNSLEILPQDRQRFQNSRGTHVFELLNYEELLPKIKSISQYVIAIERDKSIVVNQ